LVYELAPDLHVEEATVRFCGFRIQTRMAVVVLPGARLLLYSPVWLTPQLGAELARLGEVAYVLSPNKIHNLTLAAYAEAYPQAQIHAPPGLAERRPALRIDAVLGDEAPPAWRDHVDQALTAGNVFFSEAVLLHRPSRTLLVGDLVENFDASTASVVGRAFARLFGVGREPVASPELRLYTLDADAAARALARIASWDFERIFLCHGRLVTEHAKEVFARVGEGVVRAARGRSRAARALLRRLAAWQ
jgi:hypothetical protein